VFAVAGCSDNLPGKPGPQDRPVPADEVDTFDTLYRGNCAACHGADGRLGPAPPLNDPIFLAIVSEKEISDTLIGGRHNTAMASFAASPKPPEVDPAKVPAIAATPSVLTPKQIEILARGIKEKWPADKGEKLPPYSARGVKGSVAKGKEVFARACAVCHGEDGKEKGLNIHDSNFLALISEQALRRIIITGRRDLGMPSYRDKEGRDPDFKPLTNEEIDNLQALLAAWKQGSDEGK
jgi:cytochrome c oxidase cbb3-type subunit 3/ubiquinol-cytochrome c reductase cytochrome c subunit